MFIGHYGVALGAKALVPEAPLPLLMLGTQVIDVVFASLALAGVEKAEVDLKAPTVPIRTPYIPFSHSLPAALALSVAFALAAAPLVESYSPTVFWTLALVAFSHWLLDLIVHDRDLPLIGNAYKIGFGLWRIPRAARALEYAVILSGGAMLAMASVVALSKLLMVLIVMIALQAASFYRRPPARVGQMLGSMLAVYAAMTVAGWWLEL